MRLIQAMALAACAAVLAAPGASSRAQSQPAPLSLTESAGRCAALPSLMSGAWPDASTRVVSAAFDPGGAQPSGDPAPPNCDLVGVMHQRQGADGKAYAIRFHVRLPATWNGRFLFQGGGGSDGELGDARGPVWTGAPDALSRGFAVVSQDAGHDNARDSDPARGGATAFGFDPQARVDYGYAALRPVAEAAKAVVAKYYGAAPRYSYFVGCSKGGQEGLQFAERYPDVFDGIVAAAPGLSLPRAALAEAWDTQTYAALAGPNPDAAKLAGVFSDADLALVAQAVLAACDADDGLRDGIVADMARCTLQRVHPQLVARTCTGAGQSGCLRPEQVAALERAMAGPRDSQGRALYASWPWDPGLATPGWRIWKVGLAQARPPALNVSLGAAALASIFTTPPRPIAADPSALLAFDLGFDFDRDAPAIYARGGAFAHSGWQDISARADDLSAFQARGGKLIIPQGAADPVFSIEDTLAWWRAVDARAHGHASDFVRVFPVPGMNHCGGGPATDRFDALASLMVWVEHGQAPAQIIAAAGPGTPWPNRTRPLCAFPAVARYRGAGDPEKAENFSCVASKAQ